MRRTRGKVRVEKERTGQMRTERMQSANTCQELDLHKKINRQQNIINKSRATIRRLRKENYALRRSAEITDMKLTNLLFFRSNRV